MLAWCLGEWRVGIFKIIDACVSFCSRGTQLLPPGPGSSCRHLRRDVRKFHVGYENGPQNVASDQVLHCLLGLCTLKI